MARLAPGVNAAQAQASLAVLFPQALEKSDTRIEQPGIGLEDGSRGPLLLRHRAARPMWALLVVLLSGIGVYGLMAYNVTRRTGEIGVRMALGAQPADGGRPVLREALMLGAAGMAVGLPGAFLLAQGIRHFLFGIQPHDPITLIGGLVSMTLVALLAAWIPARRAMKLDPMMALRRE